MSLRQALRSGVAAISIASVVVPAGAAPATHAAPATAAKAAAVTMHVGQAATFSRIEFRGAAAATQRTGQTVTVSFNRDGDPDISRLRSSPPRTIPDRDGNRPMNMFSPTDRCGSRLSSW